MSVAGNTLRTMSNWSQTAHRPQLGGLRIAFIGGRGVAGQYSGIETFYEEAGSRLAERGHLVTVYCRSKFTPPCSVFRGMRVVRFPALPSKHLETLFHSLISMVHATLSRYDVIHIHAIGSSVFAWLPRLRGCETVVTVHALDWQRPKWKKVARWCLRLAERASVSLPSKTIAVSRAIAGYLRTEYGVESAVVPNGVNLHAAPGSERVHQLGLVPQKYVLCVGRLSEEKGFHDVIQAFNAIAPGEFHLVFAGGATYDSRYEQVLRASAGPDVRFLGWIDQQTLGELYSSSALFVLPSSLEGLSVALLEAMSYGAPVLVSDIAPNLEVVGDAGWIFRQGDVEDLASALEDALSKPAERNTQGQRGRARVEANFTWETTVDRLEEVYGSVVDRAAQPGAEG
jgi:glycosyltransferase involved in cell wall biosynthesis